MPARLAWHHIFMVRRETREGQAARWTDAYVDPHYAHVRELAEKHPDKLLTDLIEAHYGRRVESVEQTVYACAVNERLAQPLGVAKRCAGLASPAPVPRCSTHPGGGDAVLIHSVSRVPVHDLGEGGVEAASLTPAGAETNILKSLIHIRRLIVR